MIRKDRENWDAQGAKISEQSLIYAHHAPTLLLTFFFIGLVVVFSY